MELEIHYQAPATDTEKIHQASTIAKKIYEQKSEDNNYASACMPTHEKLNQRCKTRAQETGTVDAVVVVGIGGSNLGTLAILQAIRGCYYNAQKPEFYFADTTDPKDVEDLQKQLNKHEKIHAVIISKSGGTAETMMNASAMINYLKSKSKNWKQNITIITGEKSKLATLADENQIARLPIPEKVGGRYSVFSPVGLLPLMMAGIDTDKVLNGAKEILEGLKGGGVSAALAATHVDQYQNQKNVHTLFVFRKDYEAIGRWYRQLIAESIGKNEQVGITPTVNVGTTDMHSVAQQLIAGPKDTFITFVESQHEKEYTTKLSEPLSHMATELQGVGYNEFLEAVLEGTRKALDEREKPHAKITLQGSQEERVGAIMQLYMCSTMIMGEMLNVNPFDQPAVESYKREARQILSGA